MQNKVDLSYTGYIQAKDEAFYKLFDPRNYNRQLCTVKFEFDENKAASNLHLSGAELLSAFKNQLNAQAQNSKTDTLQKIINDTTSPLTINFKELTPEDKNLLLNCLYLVIHEHQFTESISLGKFNLTPLWSNPMGQLNLLEAIKSFAKANGIDPKDSFFINNGDLIKKSIDYNDVISSLGFKIFIMSIAGAITFGALSVITPIFLIGFMISLLALAISMHLITIPLSNLRRLEKWKKEVNEAANNTIDVIKLHQNFPLVPVYPGSSQQNDPVITTYPTYAPLNYLENFQSDMVYYQDASYQPTMFYPLPNQYEYISFEQPPSYEQATAKNNPYVFPPAYPNNNA